MFVLYFILNAFKGVMFTGTGAIQCVFEPQGTSKTWVSYTGPMTKSLSDCQNACYADSICLAFTHISILNTCRLLDSTETISTGCTHCTYYLKLCTSTTSMSKFLCLIFFVVVSVVCYLCIPIAQFVCYSMLTLLFVQTNRTVCLLFHVDIAICANQSHSLSAIPCWHCYLCIPIVQLVCYSMLTYNSPYHILSGMN